MTSPRAWSRAVGVGLLTSLLLAAGCILCVYEKGDEDEGECERCNRAPQHEQPAEPAAPETPATGQ